MHALISVVYTSFASIDYEAIKKAVVPFHVKQLKGGATWCKEYFVKVSNFFHAFLCIIG